MADVTKIQEKHVTINEGQKSGSEPKAEASAGAEVRKQEEKAERGRQRQARKVLIAVDGSPASNNAVEWYFEEMHKKRNIVVFLHSFELPLMHSYQEMYSSPEMWTNTLKHEADRTTAMEKNLMRKLKIHEVEGKFLARGGGKPGEAILSAADDEDVDLIILGTRGHGKLRRALLGSVSHYVMNHAHVPVIIYRQKKPKEPRSRSGSRNRKQKEKRERKGSEKGNDRSERKKSESGDERKGKKEKDAKED